MTKHTEKVDEVKKEVNFFNNYLRVGSLIRAALTVIMILFLRIRSAHSCRNTRRQRQEPEGKQVPATTGGRGGGEIPMSTGRLYSACLLACLDIAEQLSDFET